MIRARVCAKRFRKSGKVYVYGVVQNLPGEFAGKETCTS